MENNTATIFNIAEIVGGDVKPEDIRREIGDYKELTAYDVATALYRLDVDEEQIVKALRELGFGKEEIARALYDRNLGLDLAGDCIVETMRSSGYSVQEIIGAMNDGCGVAMSSIARILSDVGIDRLTIIKELQNLDSEVTPYYLKKADILDVDDASGVLELVQEMAAAREDSDEIVRTLKSLGVNSDNMAYALSHGLNINGENLLEVLIYDADFGLVETARAIAKGLEWPESVIAEAFFYFNKGARGMDVGEAVVETANILSKAGIFNPDAEYEL